MEYAEYKRRKALLTEQQRRAIASKALWEGCSWFAVAQDWPHLFEVPVDAAAESVGQ